MKRLCLFLALFLMSSAAARAAEPGAFEKLKTLTGVWEGRVTTVPATKDVEGATVRVTLRVTSMGNALLHEMKVSTRPDDPITMFYLDNGQLTLTHYCDAGNRPRMTGSISPEGKSIEFEFVDVAGPQNHGHMHHAGFTFVDADHHIEDWTFMGPGGQSVNGHFELTRVK
jgi:hypothetical protein